MLLALAMTVLIEDYATLDAKTATKVTIEDDAVARFLAAEIEKIPQDGQNLKSFSANVRHVKLTFKDEGGKEKVFEFYGGMLKTKTTGFNAPTPEVEKAAYRDVRSLLEAKYGEPLLLVPKHTYKFPDVDVTYDGEASSPQDAVNPTVSFSTRSFLLKTKDGKAELDVAISWTQQPPTTQPVTIAKKKYDLVIFDREKDLFPRRFLLR